MVLGVVAGLKNGELVMAGVVGGDCRDKMIDRLSEDRVTTTSLLTRHLSMFIIAAAMLWVVGIHMVR